MLFVLNLSGNGVIMDTLRVIKKKKNIIYTPEKLFQRVYNVIWCNFHTACQQRLFYYNKSKPYFHAVCP